MPVTDLTRTFERFQRADQQTRIELLLDYARKLPPLPERFHAAREQGLNLVHECQSPVYLWIEVENGEVHLYADAPREAPTVRGFVSLLDRAIAGASPQEVMALPSDLLDRLGLTSLLGMTRVHGLTAILQRVKRMAAEAATAA